ncbi:esterase [Pseudoduganella sp. FT26W]|uniref:Esterase n=1 Tax=Duganella aquatilis TaxID=2666082 RepID=A0A844D735_9BURK|nr:esterase [Duganella aquatilis]MRW83330.1 esterase [Duganella aquatilis]
MIVPSYRINDMRNLSESLEKYAAAVLFALAVVVAGVMPASIAKAADRTDQIEVSGQTRTYIVHVPEGSAPQGGFSLMLIFHGGGMQGKGMQQLADMDAVADQRRFITVYPNGIDKHWNDGRPTIKNPQDDVGFVLALINRMQAQYPIARNRIVAAGFSNGALFVERLGCELAGRIAGIAAVAGTLPDAAGLSCQPPSSLAVMQIDGTADPIMPFKGGPVADFGGKGEGGHVRPVAETVGFWARHNGCETPGVQQPLAPHALIDQTRVIQTSFSGCARGGGVVLLTVVGGGHAWPGGGQYAPRLLIGAASRQINASEKIADFLLSRP